MAHAINDGGQVVGYSYVGGDVTHAFEWQNGGMKDLGTLPGFTDSYAASINSGGLVVGSAYDSAGTSSDHAVLWQNGQIIDLNSLLPAKSGWILQDANAINDQGVIVGTGTFNGGSPEYFSLTLGSAPIASVSVSEALSAVSSSPVASRAIADTAANIQANLDALETPVFHGQIEFINLTDIGIPQITVSIGQFYSDYSALTSIVGDFTLVLTDPLYGDYNMNRGLPGKGATLVFDGPVANYAVQAGSVLSGTKIYEFEDVTALKFDDATDIVAQTPGTGGVVTTGNVTELYGAVFGRVPDVAGLAFYEQALKNNPALDLRTLASYFLSSPEYTGNAAHAYAQNAGGDAQFIADSYDDFLNRAPETGAIPYYQAVINTFTNGVTPGTSAYAQAALKGRAQVLVYFGASAEFLDDVQVTAQHPSDATHWLVLTS